MNSGKKTTTVWLKKGLFIFTAFIATALVIFSFAAKNSFKVHAHRNIISKLSLQQITSELKHKSPPPLETIIQRTQKALTGDLNEYRLTKIIYLYTKFWTYFDEDFTKCPTYNNCIAYEGYDSPNQTLLEQASLVMMHDSFLKNSLSYLFPQVSPETRTKQLWILKTIESPGYSANQYNTRLNGRINVTISYRRGSNIIKSYHPQRILAVPQIPKPEKGTISYKMYTKAKTKGAFAYISNCDAQHYSRIGIMEQLGNYIDVDIFGKCGPSKSSPCQQEDFECEADLHKQYHFFLSFENTLCEDYITEKFWQRLKNPSFFIPVAIGGLTLEDYTSKAPQDSFLHLYNFTSVDELGKYMKYLMDNPKEYAKYHRWRESQSFVIDARLPACKLCELAFTLPQMLARTDLAAWWNDPKKCREYP